MQPDRVGTIGRPRCEDTGKWPIEITAWMDLQHVALREMKPCQQDEFIANFDAGQSRCCLWCQLQPGFGCAFVSLHGRVLQLYQLGTDKSDRFNGEIRFTL